MKMPTAALALVVSAASFGVSALTYYEQWREHLSLVANLSFGSRIDDEKNRLVTNLNVSNVGNRTIVIGSVGLMTLMGTLDAKPTCRDLNLLIQLKMQRLNAMVSNQDLGFSPARLEAGDTVAPAMAVSSNQVISQTLSFEIEPMNTPRGADMWSGGRNVVRFCPIFSVMEPSGTTEQFMCDGWLVSAIGSPMGRHVRHFLEASPRSIELLPKTDQARCVRLDL